tara:strand:- start:958 stop:1215 length:258 start_codon:yes stop_codon:yes gene_type:complete
MDSKIKSTLIDMMLIDYSLNTYQKACIQKVIDGCVDLASYQAGKSGLQEKDVDTIADLIRGHIINILNVLEIKKDGKRRFKEAQS